MWLEYNYKKGFGVEKLELLENLSEIIKKKKSLGDCSRSNSSSSMYYQSTTTLSYQYLCKVHNNWTYNLHSCVHQVPIFTFLFKDISTRSVRSSINWYFEMLVSNSYFIITWLVCTTYKLMPIEGVYDILKLVSIERVFKVHSNRG